jgi:hypothetical protein
MAAGPLDLSRVDLAVEPLSFTFARALSAPLGAATGVPVAHECPATLNARQLLG